MSEERRDPFTPSREEAGLPNRLGVPDPDSIGLPRAKRSYVLPLAIALGVFVLLVGVQIVSNW